jgi:signal transduction histidine kinase
MLARESFAEARLGATLRACRALRHEFATPLSAASLHLELALRAASRAQASVPGKLRSGLETGRQQLQEATLLLEGLTALGNAHADLPKRVDFASVVAEATRDAAPELERRGLRVSVEGPRNGTFVEGFEQELVLATREALLAAARWASSGAAPLTIGADGDAVRFTFTVPLAGTPPGDMLFKTRSRPQAGLGPFLARWTFEAHGGHLEGSEDAWHLTIRGSLPQVTP